MTTINAREGRKVYVGESVIEDGTIVLDVSAPDSGVLGGRKIVASNVQITELLASLAKIPGVTATYEEQREPTVPERLAQLGLGAVFTLTHYGARYVKVGADRYTRADTGNIFHASDFSSWADFGLLSEGYKP